MASTPQTRGFEVGVTPGFQLANPAFFNPYASLSQGLQSGVGLGAQLADIAYRKQQQEIQAQQAAQAQALAPIHTQLLQAQLAQAQQKAAVPDIVWSDTTDTDTSKSYPAALDVVLGPDGQPLLDESGQPQMAPTGQPDIEFGDIVRTTKGIKYLPGGLTEPVEKKSTVKLASERAAESANRESLIASREAAAQAAQDRIEMQRQVAEAKNAVDLIKAQASADRAQALADNPNYQHRYVERGGKKFIQYFRRDDPTKVVHEVDAGAASSNIFAPGAVFNTGAQPAAAPAGESADADLTAALSGKYAAPAQVAATAARVPAPAQSATPAPVSFNVPNTGGSQLPVVTTKEQWASLPPGSSYLGVDGKTYIKRK